MESLPAPLAATAQVLVANAAQRRGDRPGWLAALNRYLAGWNVSQLALSGGDADPLLDRLSAPARLVQGGPKVSVILAAHQATATVTAAARSILRQSWRNLELICIDDASTDGTGTALRSLAARDSRMQVITNPVNVGAWVSRNIALARATGDWITLQDADDWSHPARLERHLRAVLGAASPPPASSVGMLRMTPEGLFDQIRPVGGDCRDGVLRHAPMSTLFASGFLKNRLGSWDCVRFGADTELMGRAACVMGHAPPRLAQFGVIALDRPGSLTNNPVTGIHPRLGVAPARAAYRAAWRAWQRDQLTPATAHLPFPPAGPPRHALPEPARVDRDALRRACASAGIPVIG
jgi:hypothetical protein